MPHRRQEAEEGVLVSSVSTPAPRLRRGKEIHLLTLFPLFHPRQSFHLFSEKQGVAGAMGTLLGGGSVSLNAA